jgi:hypothetical protein
MAGVLPLVPVIVPVRYVMYFFTGSTVLCTLYCSRVPVKRHRGIPGGAGTTLKIHREKDTGGSRDTHGTHTGHTRDTHGTTRAHTGTRITHRRTSQVTTIQTRRRGGARAGGRIHLKKNCFGPQRHVRGRKGSAWVTSGGSVWILKSTPPNLDEVPNRKRVSKSADLEASLDLNPRFPRRAVCFARTGVSGTSVSVRRIS